MCQRQFGPHELDVWLEDTTTELEKKMTLFSVEIKNNGGSKKNTNKTNTTSFPHSILLLADGSFFPLIALKRIIDTVMGWDSTRCTYVVFSLNFFFKGIKKTV